MSERACIAHGDDPHPVYHRIGGVYDGDTGWPPRQFVMRTACGHKVDDWYGIKSIRRERAALWARPCRRCFKEDDDE